MILWSTDEHEESLDFVFKAVIHNHNVSVNANAHAAQELQIEKIGIDRIDAPSNAQ